MSQNMVTIMHSCGHEKEYDFSKIQRSRHLEEASQKKRIVCLPCYMNSPRAKAQKEKNFAQWTAEQNKLSDEFEERNSFFPLKSKSEKQINTGRTHRRELLTGLYQEFVIDGSLSDSDFEKLYLEPAKVVDWPGWWIEHNLRFQANFRTVLNSDKEEVHPLPIGDFEQEFKYVLQDADAVSTENPY